MDEVIAIPLRSERRAAVVLAALRRLEAEYQVTSPATGGVPGRLTGFARGATRRVWGLLRQEAGVAEAGGVIGVLIAALCASAALTVPGLRDLLGGSADVRLALLPGLVIGAMIGVALHGGARRRARQNAADRAGTVSWLVSYVTVEPNESGTGRLRSSVLRLSLPEGAEGRLKAILQQAATTPTA